ncbi:MAG: 50S ribosomal protein L21 [Isosphaeraceae bacterium]
MYAIFEDGSHQYRVAVGDELVVDFREGEPDSELKFEKVLLVSGEGDTKIGKPTLSGATVSASIVRQFKDKKIIIQKFRRRKNHRKRTAHRQPLTAIRVTAINV